MSNILRINHETDVWPPPEAWAYSAGPRKDMVLAGFKQDAVGRSGHVAQVLKNNVRDQAEFGFSELNQGRWDFGWYAPLGASYSELYGSFWLKALSDPLDDASPTSARLFGPLHLLNETLYPVPNTGTPNPGTNNGCGDGVAVIGGAATDVDEWSPDCQVHYTNPPNLMIGSSVTHRTISFPPGEWHRIVWHYQTNYPSPGGVIEIGVDRCEPDLTKNIQVLGVVHPVTAIGLIGKRNYFEADNFIVNDTSGEVNNGYPCHDDLFPQGWGILT